MSENHKNGTSYTEEFKESVVRRLKPPTNDTVASLAVELNISRSAIYQWLRAEDGNGVTSKSSSRLTSEDKFQIVLETSTLSEEEVAAYCRRKGLYTENVKEWRAQCSKANATAAKDPRLLEKDLKQKEQRIVELSKELRTKEKALAETAALLVLSKKAHAIWGAAEVD